MNAQPPASIAAAWVPPALAATPQYVWNTPPVAVGEDAGVVQTSGPSLDGPSLQVAAPLGKRPS